MSQDVLYYLPRQGKPAWDKMNLVSQLGVNLFVLICLSLSIIRITTLKSMAKLTRENNIGVLLMNTPGIHILEVLPPLVRTGTWQGTEGRIITTSFPWIPCCFNEVIRSGKFYSVSFWSSHPFWFGVTGPWPLKWTLFRSNSSIARLTLALCRSSATPSENNCL